MIDPMGPVTIAIAPMEGVVDWHLRELLSGLGGLDRTVTEFVRVTDRLLPDHVFQRYCPELLRGSVTAGGTPVFVQLLGGQPGPMAENAAAVASLGALGIDLNFGCPARTVNLHDGGASLLKDPERVFAVSSAVRRAVPSHIPVSVKVRLGFEHKDFVVEIAQAAERAGASFLTVHARTKLEMYRPPAHWNYIAKMREAVQIPVVANGDIWSVEDYWMCRSISGCKDVALGRGLIAQPDLARQISQSVAGLESVPMPWSEVLNLLSVFFDRMYPAQERLAVSRVKQWCKFIGRNYPEAALLFDRIKILTDGLSMQRELHSSTAALAAKENLWPPPSSPFTPPDTAPIVFAQNPY